jgi:hypothetical protein
LLITTRSAMHVARFQLMTLVGGHRSELIAEGIRAPLILGLSGPPQRTIAVALTPSMSHSPLIGPVKRPRFGSIDRLIFVGLFRGLSTARDALAIVQPATVIDWHRAGF